MNNTEHLVRVERRIRRNGKEQLRRLWVAGDNVRPDDKVIANAHNVQTYKYIDEKEEPSAYRPPAGAAAGSRSQRRLAAFFMEILNIRNN